MADIVIKRKISLEFLGDDYKDSFLVFKAIPIADYDDLIKEIELIENDNHKANQKIIEILSTQFVDGLFEGQKVSASDIQQFDGQTILKCFEILTGQRSDPKD